MISILVPVYKVEQYVQRCIDSVLSQSFQDWELILVDDGSPDKSPQICDQNAAKDKRIKVIHKSNGGLPSARMEGYKASEGDYLLFLDSDDWLFPDALQTLNDAITSDGGYDIVRSMVKRVSEKGDEWLEHYGIESGIIEGENRFLKTLQGDSVAPYLHSAIYRADLFSEAVFKVLIDFRISVGEDWFVNYYVAPKVKRVKFISTPTFAYFVNTESMMGGSVYGWDYYDRIENCKKRINQELGVVEGEEYHILKAVTDLRYFFFPEVPFSWSHFKKIQPWAKKRMLLDEKKTNYPYTPKHLRFISYPWLYFIYTTTYRFLFYVVKLKCKKRKVIK